MKTIKNKKILIRNKKILKRKKKILIKKKKMKLKTKRMISTTEKLHQRKKQMKKQEIKNLVQILNKKLLPSKMILRSNLKLFNKMVNQMLKSVTPF